MVFYVFRLLKQRFVISHSSIEVHHLYKPQMKVFLILIQKTKIKSERLILIDPRPLVHFCLISRSPPLRFFWTVPKIFCVNCKIFCLFAKICFSQKKFRFINLLLIIWNSIYLQDETTFLPYVRNIGIKQRTKPTTKLTKIRSSKLF